MAHLFGSAPLLAVANFSESPEEITEQDKASEQDAELAPRTSLADIQAILDVLSLRKKILEDLRQGTTKSEAARTFSLATTR